MSDAPRPPVPRYGEASLADLVPSVLSALGLPGFPNALSVEPLAGVFVLVVDGLGWVQLLEYSDSAPFMAATAGEGRPITAGFPSTTSASLASLGTGLAPGEHGLVGYTFAIPGYERPLNSLLWQLYGIGPSVDLSEELVPERFQPHPTLLERSEAAGLPVTVIGPPDHARSPLTRAILRGGRYEGAHTLGELVSVASIWLQDAGRGAVYAYHPFLDTTGHLRGVGSPEWLEYLTKVDQAAGAIADRLPSGWALVITGDHGMVNLDDGDRIDVADAPDLLEGVRFLAGEARARHVHVEAGADDDVLAAWRGHLGDRAWVLLGEEAIEAGWFGPVVADRVRPRIGDVVAAARDRTGVFQKEVDPLHFTLIGHHGSLTPEELLVPLLVVRGG
jgi:hypothetical protein